MSDDDLQAATPEEVVETSEVPAEEPTTDEADTSEAQETDEQKNERVQREAQERAEKKSRGVQKRLDELTREKYEERKRADDLVALNARLVAMMEAKSAPAATQADGEPDREQFKTADGYYDDVAYLRAVARYDAKVQARELLEQQQKIQQETSKKQTAEQEAQAAQREFVQRAKEVKKTIPDYQDVIDDWSPDLPESVQEMIVRLPDGPLLAYHLAKNPELESQFSSQPAYMHGVLLGQLITTLKSSSKTTTAPPPGKPVQSKAGTATEPPSDPEQYRAWADKHLR